MSQSNVGNAQVYEAGDQRNVSKEEVEQEKKDLRFHEGKENSHKANDSSKDTFLCIIIDAIRSVEDGLLTLTT